VSPSNRDTILKTHLVDITRRFCDINIAVIGDIILDHYIWGGANRISPEAPVPVVQVESETFRLGGAANVVANILSLDGHASIIGVVGKDASGQKLADMLQEAGANLDGLVTGNDRQTTLKTRVIAQHQQIVRIDRETDCEIDEACGREITRISKSIIPEVDAVIISDYDKGVVSEYVLREIFPCAKEHGKPVVVDPKFRNFGSYEGATIVAPNLKEASAAAGMAIADEGSLVSVGNALLRKLRSEAVLITRGEHGMSLFRGSDGSVVHIPAVAKEVFDVTGAGDTVVAVFALALAAGASMLDAARLSNYAAGIVVGKLGTACVSPDELVAALNEEE
jgi:rfaE bifunctional protein kinase chain/domain